MQQTEKFTLRKSAVVCPTCESTFTTPRLTAMPAITGQTPIETDLHRVLPNGAIRASLIAICSSCGYAWWITAFKAIECLDDVISDFESANVIELPRKFASAYMTGVLKNTRSHEMALIAMNGAWCSREAGLPHDRWLELAAEEIEKTLLTKEWNGNRGYFHYLLGEVCRQQGRFEQAIQHFNKVTFRSRIPRELVLRQKVQATAGDSSVTLMPPYLVEHMFCASNCNRSALYE